MMSDGMTDEQRERLKQWQKQEGLVAGEVVPFKRVAQPEAKRMVEHLKQELNVLQRCSENEETLVGLFYYSQAIADLEYFVEHGVSLREAESPHTRGQRGTVVSRTAMMDAKTE